jgi:UPF0755 protein
MLRKLLYFLILSSATLCSVVYAHFQVITWSNSEIYLPGKKIIELKRGQDLKSLSRELHEQGLIDNRLVFEYWVKLYERYNLFQAGLYLFENSISPKLIVEQIKAGKIHVPIELTLAIPEGSSIKDVCRILEDKKVTDFDSCLHELKSNSYLIEAGLAGTDMEGFIYPATYSFSKKPELRDFIQQALIAFKKNILELTDRLAERGLSLYQGLIFASLIEKEVASFNEYPKVSEVIWARLQSNMALGIDAAVIYGISDFDGDITFDHLKDPSNPYNLRIHVGLPPTPICSPSKAALEAVINPTAVGYLYYVKAATEEKRHHFSKNLAEHNRFVQELVKYEKNSQ